MASIRRLSVNKRLLNIGGLIHQRECVTLTHTKKATPKKLQLRVTLFFNSRLENNVSSHMRVSRLSYMQTILACTKKTLLSMKRERFTLKKKGWNQDTSVWDKLVAKIYILPRLREGKSLRKRSKSSASLIIRAKKSNAINRSYYLWTAHKNTCYFPGKAKNTGRNTKWSTIQS